MMWTKDLPICPGWYWRRDQDDPNGVVCEVRYFAGALAIGNSYISCENWKRSEWAGPIPKPIEI